MAVRPYIFIVPSSPVFNRELTPVFEKFSKTDSALLFEALYLNHLDLLSKLNNEYNTVYCFDERDRDFLPEPFQNDSIEKYFVRTNEVWKGMKKLIAGKINQESQNILMLFSNSIAITPGDISRYFNFLNHDDYNIVVGKSDDEKVGAVGINYYEDRLMADFTNCDIPFESILRHSGKLNSYLFTMNGLLTVNNLENFRSLYRILSKKESLEFCSHEIHDLFTHLFIEYKELL